MVAVSAVALVAAVGIEVHGAATVRAVARAASHAGIRVVSGLSAGIAPRSAHATPSAASRVAESRATAETTRAPVDAVAIESRARELAGRVFLIGFEGDNPSDPEVKRARRHLEEGRAAGVVVLARNLPRGSDPAYSAKVRRLVSYLTEGITPRPILAVDQEGGVVQRIAGPYPDIASNQAIGRERDLKRATRRAYEAGALAASQLAELGFNLNFSPVVDVYRADATKPAGGASDPQEMLMLDRRSFGSDPDRVAALGAEVVRAHNDAGIVSCAKHFPGHGVTSEDTHTGAPSVAVDRELLRDVDLLPFVGAIRAGVPLIMTAHVVNTRIDPTAPATLSARAIDVLRGALRFEGAIVADDMTMEAIRSQPGGSSLSAVRALQAGVDALIYAWKPAEFGPAYNAVVNAIIDGSLPQARAIDAAQRVGKVREELTHVPRAAVARR